MTRMFRGILTLAFLILVGCKGDTSTEPPIQSTRVTTKATKVLGQPKLKTEIDPPPPKKEITKGKKLPPLNGGPLDANEAPYLGLANEARIKAKLPPLKANPVLIALARAHSAKMANDNAKKKDGERDLDLDADMTGYDYLSHAVTVGTSGRLDPEFTMASQNVRMYVANPDYTEMGVGVFQDDTGRFYHTEIFAQPK